MACNSTDSGLMRVKAIAVALVVCVAAAGPALAQDNAAASAPEQRAIGAAALLHVQARVVAIDPATNSVTLRGPQGGEETFDVNPQAADVSKLHVGDVVTIAYKKAVLVGVDKLAPNGIRQRIDTEVTQPAANGVVASARRIEVVATVRKIDRKKRTITLRGPSRTETLDVAPDIALEKLKVGDSVRAVFVSAIAASVSRNGADVK
ncbi:Cu/Ag efflux protein CusF [Paraburkholderia sp. HC6.4b]|uniref:copper-binding protein n=1 Tax=unclassified Paraburkholderia TaxID=2615204 RepID=UPI0016159ED6|nr:MULTISPECIES: copper-binding protein [unclassified Paraburkholderia]MBB5412648.1 Cu/Ag efflux protein CusF [Paraburkholderia sp. HC6.4b]MBB5454748.1 Cu/Ag efflux protein CusF [Paraburkholderia sp. Kb1A]